MLAKMLMHSPILHISLINYNKMSRFAMQEKLLNVVSSIVECDIFSAFSQFELAEGINLAKLQCDLDK